MHYTSSKAHSALIHLALLCTLFALALSLTFAPGMALAEDTTSSTETAAEESSDAADESGESSNADTEGSSENASSTEEAVTSLDQPTITAATGTPTKIKVTWDAVEDAESYIVYRATKGSSGWGSYKKLGTTTKTSYTDTTGAAGKVYRYKVKAVAGSVTSKASASKGFYALGTPSIKSVSGYESRVTVTWGKVTNATKYYVYRATKKSDGSYGSYKKIATTTAKSYTDTTAKYGKTYRYKVKAVRGSSDNGNLSTSKASGYKAIKKVRLAKTVIVGECFAVGMKSYGSYGSNVKFVAQTGLSTISILSGDYLDQAVAYNPDRIVFICGINEACWYSSPSSTVSRYKKIIKLLHNYDSDLEIVIMALPWTSGSYKKYNSRIQNYNKKLKALCSNYSYVYYYSEHRTTLKSSSGNYLAAKYNGGDGLHWTAAAYKKVLKDLIAWTRTM